VSEQDAEVDLGHVVGEIQAAVAANTESGVYSPDLETALASHYARLLDRSDGRDQFDSARLAIQRVRQASTFSRSRIDTASGMPGGEIVHKVAGKAVSRQVLGVMQQLTEFSDALMPALQALLNLSEDPRGHTHEDVLHEVDTVQDRLAEVERSLTRIASSVELLSAAVPRFLAHTSELEGLSSRLEALEDAEHRRRFTPLYSSLDFDAVSRGDEASIKAEYASVADRLVGAPGPVIDIGAGRGEFLELLRERGVDAFGLELEDDLVERAAERGLDVRPGDGITALRETEPGTLGGIVLIHVIEHLGKNELLELVSLARTRLAIGGKLVLETPNPQSLYVYARAFYLDPTQPVHPIYLEFILRKAGFDHVEYDWTAPPSADEQMVQVEGDDELTAAFNENARRINQLVYAPQNYRVIAIR
jgi:hypothetical protein